MKNRLITNTIILLIIAFQATWYAILWINYFHSSDLLRESDFLAFYSAGKISNDYGNDQIYNLDLEHQVQEKVVGLNFSKQNTLTFNHPPILLPFLKILACFNYETAYLLNSLLLFLISLACIPFFIKSFKSVNASKMSIWMIILGVILFEPLFISILKGQDTALFFLGLSIWFTGLIRGDDRQAGIGLALTTIRPQISILLVFPHLFRKPKVFAWYTLGACLLVVYSYLLVGNQGISDYLHLLQVSNTGQGFGLNQTAMFNFSGLLLRSFPNINPTLHNSLKWGMYFFSMIASVILWKRSSKISYSQVLYLVIASLFFSPHLHYHDLAVLSIPILCVLIIFIEAKIIQNNKAGLCILLISTILLISEIFDPLRFVIPYTLLAFLFVAAWKTRNYSFDQNPPQNM
jgi:hypothetical protein